jgi:hypothetical protein
LPDNVGLISGGGCRVSTINHVDVVTNDDAVWSQQIVDKFACAVEAEAGDEWPLVNSNLTSRDFISGCPNSTQVIVSRLPYAVGIIVEPESNLGPASTPLATAVVEPPRPTLRLLECILIDADGVARRAFAAPFFYLPYPSLNT